MNGRCARPAVAVMQPYIFPYLGYFQLIAASDVFVFYDDVTFIKRGWINRNWVRSGSGGIRFTLPLLSASQHRKICEIHTAIDQKWLRKFWSSLEQSYRRAANFEVVRDLIAGIFYERSDPVSDVAIESVRAVMAYLGLNRSTVRSSERCMDSQGIGRVERLVAITKQFGGRCYLNSPGGAHLYDEADFREFGLEYRLLPQQCAGEVANNQVGPMFLSIIDDLMRRPREAVLSDANVRFTC